MLLLSPKKNIVNSVTGYGVLARSPVWLAEPEPSSLSLKEKALWRPAALSAWVVALFACGSLGSWQSALKASKTSLVEGESPLFPPEVALHLVKIACEMPDQLGRSLSVWDCEELARILQEDGTVESISAETVRRILNNHHLKPWRHHMWLGDKTPRDDAFYAQVKEICHLYTRPLHSCEIVLSLDEKTSLQPRTRKSPTKPAKPKKSVRVEHEYTRKGALNLFAAFDTRTGNVYGRCFRRKRQLEFISFLEYLDAQIPDHITTIHIVCDNLRVHKGKEVMKWLSKYSRFLFHFTPVHCSWMNQVEQWFSILQRKRFKIADFATIEDLRDKIYGFITQWNKRAHPFKWTTKSVAKIMAYADPHKEAA
jgi:transposase